MSNWTLREFDDVEEVKGLLFPAGISMRRLIVTGPPGCGKSTEIEALGGWPEEGFLDLTERRWWRSRVLSFRPREVHLGLPFQGHRAALTPFDDEWLRTEPAPRLNLSRICLPPSHKWRSRYVFCFLLPPPSEVFAARQERAYRQSHPVDVAISIERVQAQLEAYRATALQLHRAGLKVFVRDRYAGAPLRFEADDSREAAWDLETRAAPPLIARMLEMLAGTSRAPVAEGLEEVRLQGKTMRIPLELLPAEVAIGPQRLRITAERLLDGTLSGGGPHLLVFDPDQYANEISGFVRLAPDGRTRIGKGAEDRLISSRLPSDTPPRLEIAFDGRLVSVIDLHSPTGTIVRGVADLDGADQLRTGIRERLARLGRIVGAPIQIDSRPVALERLRDVNRRLERHRFRPPDDRGRPGGLVQLPVDVTPVIIGDLHANLDNLLTVLSANRFLDEVERGGAAILLLGDAVHPEEGDLEEMESSILMMDVLFRLLQAFPDHFVYVRGNHDSFSREVTKAGVPQGQAWSRALKEARGPEYVEEMQRFYDRLPLIAASTDFVTCHGGPPLETVTRDRLINLYRHPTLCHQLSWNRLQKASNPGGYTKREARALKRALGVRRADPLIVSHTPARGAETVWLDHGGIPAHHIVHSANLDNVGVFTRIGGQISPLVYPAQRLTDDLRDPGP